MPGRRFSEKEDRQAQHVADSMRARGKSAREARSIGYATVNKHRSSRRGRRGKRG